MNRVGRKRRLRWYRRARLRRPACVTTAVAAIIHTNGVDRPRFGIACLNTGMKLDEIRNMKAEIVNIVDDEDRDGIVYGDT